MNAKAYAARLKRINRAHEEAMVRRRAQAQEEGRRLAAEIYRNVDGVRAVWGFGSVFESRRPFGEQSDIDLKDDEDLMSRSIRANGTRLQPEQTGTAS